ncbi:hypothetical protein CQW23_19750 [Capsicum baccatum]|uniref:SWIM-type domain-containing protein n=1 Tax=Capsicum baccatum TaxID=33114 RepID=A0A2G2W6P6_CAPBA|nr:hypothetical protein CQW23_19750 [Capsicum baccatum]
MLDVATDGSRLSLRINVIPGSPIIPPPQRTINEHDSFENESLNAHPMELKNPSFSEEVGEECRLGAQTNHTFSDETNFWLNQIFSSKKELKLLLDVTVVRNSFGYATLKSCGKFLKIYILSPIGTRASPTASQGLMTMLITAYSTEEFSNHFEEFKNYCPEAAFFLKHELDCDKWSRAYFPGNRFDLKPSNITESINSMLITKIEYPVASIFNLIDKSFGDIFRDRRAYVLKCKDNKFMSTAEKILRDNMSEGDSFYVENISGDKSKFTVFSSGCTTKVDLLKRSCSCRKFELVKISCAHPIASLQLKHGDDYGLRVYDYSSPVYKVEEYLLAYSKSINIIPLESE